MCFEFNLKKIFVSHAGSSEWVIRYLRCRMHSGETVGIIGKNGSGKSTLAYAILGIIPNLAPGSVEGVIEWQSKNLIEEEFLHRLKAVGYSFQDIESQILFGRVRDVIGLTDLDADQDLLALGIRILKVGHLLDRQPGELSGGEAQRVALVSTFRQGPKINIFDEASSALDPQARKDFCKLVEELKFRRHIVLLLGQRPEIISPLSDTLHFLHGGKLVQYSKVENIQVNSSNSNSFWDSVSRPSSLPIPELSLESVTCIRKGTSKFTLGPISFSIKPGETVAVLGPNGSGKSSLFLALIGVLKSIKGNFCLNNKKHKSTKNKNWAKNISMISQSPLSQMIGTTVYEELNLEEKFDSCESRRFIFETIQSHFPFLSSEKDPLDLSYGQQRMLMILSETINKKPILLIDEPEQGLDHKSLQYLSDYIKRNKESSKKSIIFSTHDFEIASELADRFLLFKNGKIVTSAGGMNTASLEKWYFDQIGN